MDDLRRLEAEYRTALYEFHKTHIELLTMKLEFGNTIITWLDKLQMEYPATIDSLQPLFERLLEETDRMDEELIEHFDAMLEVSDLDA